MVDESGSAHRPWLKNYLLKLGQSMADVAPLLKEICRLLEFGLRTVFPCNLQSGGTDTTGEIEANNGSHMSKFTVPMGPTSLNSATVLHSAGDMELKSQSWQERARKETSAQKCKVENEENGWSSTSWVEKFKNGHGSGQRKFFKMLGRGPAVSISDCNNSRRRGV
jgi:hypothetical protein